MIGSDRIGPAEALSDLDQGLSKALVIPAHEALAGCKNALTGDAGAPADRRHRWLNASAW
jgi:hypothetical protein